MRAVFERRRGDAIESAQAIFDVFPDPEMVFFAARNIAFFGERRALQELERSLARGFVLYRVLLRDDPWLDPLRSTPEFQFLVERSREAYRQCRRVRRNWKRRSLRARCRETSGMPVMPKGLREGTRH